MQYCAQRRIEFTRSRAYRKNDQAWIEQKNGSVVRRFTGHDRYSGRIAGQTMVHLYQTLRLYVNYFQPSFKLLEKMRDGAKTIKRYSPPATPCDRLLQYDTIAARTKEEPSEYRSGLDPVALLRSIREAQSALAAISSPEPPATVSGESLERFLACLPSLWQQGEARPTHKARAGLHRHWRALLATGVPARIPSRACGSKRCCGSRKILTPTPRTCWRDCAKLIPTGLEMLSCEHSSAESRTGVESWPKSWSTLLQMTPYRNGKTEVNWS